VGQLLVLTAAMLTGTAARPATAATTIPVDCAANPNALSVAFANASAGDRLEVAGTCTGALDIAKDITLVGTGGATIDARSQAIRVITIRAGANVTIAGLSITGGRGFAGVGIHNLGTLTLTNSTVSGNIATLWGGGIYNRFGATLRIDQSTVTGNTAGETGGGLYNDGALTLVDSTISSNDGGLGGGGLFNSSFGTLTVESSTIADNRASVVGGGIANIGSVGQATLRNTILAASSGTQNCSGPVTDGGYNLDDGTSCGFDVTQGSLAGTNPLFDPAGLRDNGGPTHTLALQPTSPAIDVIPPGSNGCGTSVTVDQRGVSRPQGARCDIGAFERVADTTPPVVTVPVGLTTDATASVGAVLSYAASATDDVDGAVPISCSPPSGSTFPIGTTTVTCTATDAAGNGASATFDVYVKGAAAQLADLESAVEGVGPGTSFADRVGDARATLSSGKLREACELLAALGHQIAAQEGKSITEQQAAELLATVARIRAVLAC
jgi:hypothetical protein